MILQRPNVQRHYGTHQLSGEEDAEQEVATHIPGCTDKAGSVDQVRVEPQRNQPNAAAHSLHA
jgi:hypothetical protein